MKNGKKNKKDIYIITFCLFLLIISLGAIIINKKATPNEEIERENILEPKEEEETVKNKFEGYELKENNFRDDTNQELKVLFDKEELNEDDVLKLSNSMVKGYLYLLEKNKSGTVSIKKMSSQDLGVLTAEFLYTTQKKVCTDMSFLEELVVLLFGEVDINLGADQNHYNEYNNSYCLERIVNNYKYHLVYDDHSYTRDYVTISYRKIVDNNNEGILKVYFKHKDNRYILERIDL